MERKIGERFTDNGVLLEVVEVDKEKACVGCYYDRPFIGCADEYNDSGSCWFERREDNKEVIFKKVEEKQ